MTASRGRGHCGVWGCPGRRRCPLSLVPPVVRGDIARPNQSGQLRVHAGERRPHVLAGPPGGARRHPHAPIRELPCPPRPGVFCLPASSLPSCSRTPLRPPQRIRKRPASAATTGSGTITRAARGPRLRMRTRALSAPWRATAPSGPPIPVGTHPLTRWAWAMWDRMARTTSLSRRDTSSARSRPTARGRSWRARARRGLPAMAAPPAQPGSTGRRQLRSDTTARSTSRTTGVSGASARTASSAPMSAAWRKTALAVRGPATSHRSTWRSIGEEACTSPMRAAIGSSRWRRTDGRPSSPAKAHPTASRLT